LSAPQSFERGNDGVFHRETFVAGQTRRETGLEVDHVVAGAIFAKFVGDAFLRLGEREDAVEDFKALQIIGQAPTIPVDLKYRASCGGS